MLFASAPASFHHACIHIWKKRTLCGCPIFNKVHRVLLWLKKYWLVQDHKFGNHGDEINTLENCNININGEILKPADSNLTVKTWIIYSFLSLPFAYAHMCIFLSWNFYPYLHIRKWEKTCLIKMVFLCFNMMSLTKHNNSNYKLYS